MMPGAPVAFIEERDRIAVAVGPLTLRIEHHGSTSVVGLAAIEDYPDAANDIKALVTIVKGVRWHNFPEVRGTFKDADKVRGYVIFNIRQNRYRLVTVIHYAKTTAQKRTQGHVYIRSFLTHKKYDNPGNWDRRFGTK